MCSQRPIQIVAQVVKGLQADAEPDQAVADAEGKAVGWVVAGVRHRGGLLDQRFNGPQTDGQLEEPTDSDHEDRRSA